MNVLCNVQSESSLAGLPSPPHPSLTIDGDGASLSLHFGVGRSTGEQVAQIDRLIDELERLRSRYRRLIVEAEAAQPTVNEPVPA